MGKDIEIEVRLKGGYDIEDHMKMVSKAINWQPILFTNYNWVYKVFHDGEEEEDEYKLPYQNYRAIISSGNKDFDMERTIVAISKIGYSKKRETHSSITFWMEVGTAEEATEYRRKIQEYVLT